MTGGELQVAADLARCISVLQDCAMMASLATRLNPGPLGT
jgi:hypothetical protein